LISDNIYENFSWKFAVSESVYNRLLALEIYILEKIKDKLAFDWLPLKVDHYSTFASRKFFVTCIELAFLP
jgi:hypothetical protein